MMNAVIFYGPGQVAVEKRPVPQIHHPKDIVARVEYTALCGSDLHLFRGHEACAPGTVMGHEFCGVVVEIGDDIKNLEVGDLIVSPFTVSCGDCFYCQNGLSSRCTECLVLGTEQLGGAQAQYVRVPLADTTVVKAPDGFRSTLLVLMADIFPTGYFAASSAFSRFTPAQARASTAIIVGCGPVGLCALIASSSYRPLHLFAIDSVPSRLALARNLGARPLNSSSDADEIESTVKGATAGRGADIVVELVGLQPALRLAFDLVRPGGVLVSLGVHHEDYPWTPAEAYGKNLQVKMGRCPVRSVFEDALEVLKENQHLLGFMEEKIMPLSDAAEGYRLFDRKEVQKVIFEAQK